MGFKRTYTCPSCRYSVLTGAGKDGGIGISNNTFVCKECRVIIDKVTDRFTKKAKPSPLFLEGLSEWLQSEMNGDSKSATKPQKPREENKCECDISKLDLWDIKNKPCPKCGTSMRPDPTGIRMNWD